MTTDAQSEMETVPGSDPEHLERIWKLAYAARTKEDLEDLYATWAETYDDDHASIGFVGHRTTAALLVRHLTRPDTARVLDAGAGTGAAAEALRALGVRNLVGVDLSDAMLERARSKGLYISTHVADISLPLDGYAESSFDAAILVGVFSYGQAPAESIDEMVRLVRSGGVIALTMRTDFYEEDAMGVRSRIETLLDHGVLELLERTKPEPYLPKKDPDAMFSAWCFRVTADSRDETEEGFEEAIAEAFAADEPVVEIDHQWIWDSTASRLYDRYTRSSGYYLTDVEESILREYAADIYEGERTIVELGCGSARKIVHVIDAALESGVERLTYVPIDVSPGALRATEREVSERFGERVEIQPRQGLFQDVLASIPKDQRKLVFFFGSSIGNLPTRHETVEFLQQLADRLGHDDRLVVGTDLHKDAGVFERAYNEEESCRMFFVHMLRRINEHLGADFDPRVFGLQSTYEVEEPYEGIETWRMNLRVASRVPQRTFVRQLGTEVKLEAGQPVQVGISRKFDAESVGGLAALAHLELRRRWLDERSWFALNELVRSSA